LQLCRPGGLHWLWGVRGRLQGQTELSRRWYNIATVGYRAAIEEGLVLVAILPSHSQLSTLTNILSAAPPPPGPVERDNSPDPKHLTFHHPRGQPAGHQACWSESCENTVEPKPPRLCVPCVDRVLCDSSSAHQHLVHHHQLRANEVGGQGRPGTSTSKAKARETTR